MAEDVDTPRKKGRDPILTVGTIVLALAFVVVISGYAYGELFGAEPDEPARYGDRVQVDYVGSFYGWYDGHDGIGPGVVFDTSLWSVASDESIPKSWGFNERKEDQYTPFNVTIGSGGALADFESALIGMKPGETKYIMIPNGYGEVPQAAEKIWEMTANMGFTETMFAAQFRDTFGLTSASTGLYEDLDHPYGWKSQAIYNSDGTVTVTHLVEDGETYDVTENEYMSVKVTYLSPTQFKVNFIFDYDKITFLPEDPSNPGAIQLVEFKYGGQTFFITNINEAASGFTFTTKSTTEIIGMNLYFKITFLGYQ